MDKYINDMTRKEFESLPTRKWNEDIGEFDSLVILPTKHIHDSGYRCMDFVACKSGKPICRLSGCSDVIHIEGIGGYGKDWLERPNTFPRMKECIGWNIDCLKKSGLLQIFTNDHDLIAGLALSSFELWSGNKRKRG